MIDFEARRVLLLEVIELLPILLMRGLELLVLLCERLKLLHLLRDFIGFVSKSQLQILVLRQ